MTGYSSRTLSSAGAVGSVVGQAGDAARPLRLAVAAIRGIPPNLSLPGLATR